MEIAKYLDKATFDFGGAGKLREKEHFYCFEKAFSVVINLVISLAEKERTASFSIEGCAEKLYSPLSLTELESKISHYTDIFHYSSANKFIMHVMLDSARFDIEFIMDPILVYITTSKTVR